MWPFKKKQQLLVFTAPGAVSAESAERIKKMALEQFPDAKVLVLGDGLHVQQVNVTL